MRAEGDDHQLWFVLREQDLLLLRPVVEPRGVKSARRLVGLDESHLVIVTELTRESPAESLPRESPISSTVHRPIADTVGKEVVVDAFVDVLPESPLGIGAPVRTDIRRRAA